MDNAQEIDQITTSLLKLSDVLELGLESHDFESATNKETTDNQEYKPLKVSAASPLLIQEAVMGLVGLFNVKSHDSCEYIKGLQRALKL